MKNTYKKVKLIEIAELNSRQIDKNFTYKYIQYIDVSSVTKGSINNIQYLKTTEAPSRAKRLVEKNDILYSTVRPNLEHYVFIKEDLEANTVASTGFVVITPKKGFVDPYYLHCLITRPQYTQYLSQIAEQAVSTYPTITPNVMADLELTLPPLSEQKRIANILSSFDNKIEILKKENKILEDIAQNIFKEWFVKYNFPNKDGKPYKDNGGQMIDSELGPIPEGWRVGKLGEYFPVTTGKRNANHARENGEYMFFTCSQDNLLCDEYSFNNGALLLAGNGDFNIKWYKGKFDAYQRTYVLIPYNQEQLGYLFFLMKHYLSDIIIGNRGSVISFITKGMIEDFTVFIPNEKIEKQANKVFSSIIQQQAQNDTKINVLTKTKNTLIKDLIK